MRLTLTHDEYSRNGSRVEAQDGVIAVPRGVETALKRFSREYRTNPAGMVVLALSYYFGDGSDHLGCSDCEYFWPCTEYNDGFVRCQGLEPGGKTPIQDGKNTLPLLDKGSVVVGQPSNDMVF